MNEGFFKNSFFLFFLSILFSSAHYLICRKLVFVTYKLRSIRVCVCTIHVLSIARVLFFSLQRLTLTRHSQPSCLTNILTTNTHTHAMYIFRYLTLNYCWSCWGCWLHKTFGARQLSLEWARSRITCAYTFDFETFWKNQMKRTKTVTIMIWNRRRFCCNFLFQLPLGSRILFVIFF